MIRLRLHLVIGSLALAASIQQGVSAGEPPATAPDGDDAYSEDFSHGASGWIGGHDAKFYEHVDFPFYAWDPKRQALYVRQPTKNTDGDDHVFFRPIGYRGGSFTLRFNLYVISPGYDAALSFGLSTAPNDAWSERDPAFIRFIYSHSDVGLAILGDVKNEDRFERTRAQLYDTRARWWHHEVLYDAAAKRIRVHVTPGRDGSEPPILVVEDTLPAGFPDTMHYLVFSDNRNHGEPGSDTKEVGVGYLDDVYFVNRIERPASEPVGSKPTRSQAGSH